MFYLITFGMYWNDIYSGEALAYIWACYILFAPSRKP